MNKKEALDIFDKYYQMHQLSKNVNLLEMCLRHEKFNAKNLPGYRCVCKCFEIVNCPWSKSSLNGSCSSDTCFYVKKDIKEYFGNIAQELDHNADCEKCYQFFMDRYFKRGGGVKLRKTSKTTRKS